jgi:hypothetical protein
MPLSEGRRTVLMDEKDIESGGEMVQRASSWIGGAGSTFAALAVLCAVAGAWVCVGCKGSNRAAASVPEDCRQFLATYFEALKRHDTETIIELCSHVAARDSAVGAPEHDLVRETKKTVTATLLQKLAEQRGEFRKYSVESCTVRTIASGDAPMNVIGEGRHVEIICESTYSKGKAKESFVLYRGPQDTELIVDAHTFTFPP